LPSRPHRTIPLFSGIIAIFTQYDDKTFSNIDFKKTNQQQNHILRKIYTAHTYTKLRGGIFSSVGRGEIRRLTALF